MSLKGRFQNLLGKDKETLQKQSALTLAPEAPAQVQVQRGSPEELIRRNREKASVIAVEIDILRSQLLQIMSHADVDKIQQVDADLAEIESTLKGAKVATAELGNADEIAINVVRGLDSLLRSPAMEGEAEEALQHLKTALQEDWFRNGEENARRLRRILSLLLIQEDKSVLDQQIEGLRKWAGRDAAQLKALMDSDKGTEHNAEIMRLTNHIKKLKLDIDGKEALKTDLSIVQDALAYALQYTTKKTSAQLVQKEGEIAEAEHQEELRNVVAEKEKNKQKMIYDKVSVDMLKERLMESGIALPDIMEINELISEFAAEEEILSSETTEVDEHKTVEPILI